MIQQNCTDSKPHIGAANKVAFRIIAYASPAYKQSVALREELMQQSHGASFASAEGTLKDATHVAGFLGEELCSTAVLVADGASLKMQRVATKRCLQNRGIGAALLLFCEEYALKHGYTSIYCYAKGPAIAFYLKQHYMLEGKPFEEYGMTHHKMRKFIRNSQG